MRRAVVGFPTPSDAVYWHLSCWGSSVSKASWLHLDSVALSCMFLSGGSWRIRPPPMLLCPCSILPHEEGKHISLSLPFVVDCLAHTSRRYSTTDPNPRPGRDQISIFICVSVETQLPGSSPGACRHTYTHFGTNVAKPHFFLHGIAKVPSPSARQSEASLMGWQGRFCMQ